MQQLCKVYTVIFTKQDIFFHHHSLLVVNFTACHAILARITPDFLLKAVNSKVLLTFSFDYYSPIKLITYTNSSK